MTITTSIGKFNTELKNTFMLGTCKREAELNITWVSCGVYRIEVRFAKPLEKEDNPHIQPKVDFQISLAPEWIEKSIELFPTALKRDRMESYQSFYHGYLPDPGMFDFCRDSFFQAFKDPVFEDRVTLAVTTFNYGIPSSIQSLNLKFEELKRLKTFLDNPNGHGLEIFYSGCKIDMNSFYKKLEKDTESENAEKCSSDEQ